MTIQLTAFHILCVENGLFKFLDLEDICNIISVNKSILSLYKKGKIQIDLSILFKNININNNILKQLIKLESKTIKDKEIKIKKKKDKRQRTSSPKFRRDIHYSP